MKLGDFTSLAKNYNRYRVGYSDKVLDSIISLLDMKMEKADVVDIGAGTGIWTRMLEEKNPQTIHAIEPNNEMLKVGKKVSKDTKIIWNYGTGEKTNLRNYSADLVTMASSFHWVNFDVACKEFYRILRKNGILAVLWNPRIIEKNKKLNDLEKYIFRLKPDLQRISSGNSKFTENLSKKLLSTKLFENIEYFEDFHSISVTPIHYIEAWKTVNDIQSQLGKEKFNLFIEYLHDNLLNEKKIEILYKTKAWCCKKKT